MMMLFGSVRWDEMEDLPHDLWLAMKARVDAWREGKLPGR